MRIAVLLSCAALLAPLAFGQAHEHDAPAEASPVQVILDVGGGEVQAGDLARFEVAVLGSDLVPDRHQDMHIRVWLSGRILFETTAGSGHDYDGVNQFDVVFPRPGPFRVEAVGDDGEILAASDGWAIAADAKPVTAHVEGPAAATAGELVAYRFWPEDANGTHVQHFYVLFEVRDGSTVVYRAKLHGHDEADLGPAEVQFALAEAGDYVVSGTIYQASPYGPQHLAFAPVSVTQNLAVQDAAPALPIVPDLAAATPPELASGGDDVVGLVGTYDPSPEVGPATLQHLGVLATDAGMLRGHSNFVASLTGPGGNVLFQSRHLHESDGILEVATTQPVPGTYTWSVAHGASDGPAIALPYLVKAPTSPDSIGPQTVTVQPPALREGEASPFSISIQDALGQPFQHGEVDATITDAHGVPVLVTKLHTHGDGNFPFIFAPAAPGDYTLALSPFALEPRPATFQGDLVVPFTAGPGEPWPSSARPLASPTIEPASEDAFPWLPVGAAAAVLVLGALGVVVFLRSKK